MSRSLLDPIVSLEQATTFEQVSRSRPSTPSRLWTRAGQLAQLGLELRLWVACCVTGLAAFVVGAHPAPIDPAASRAGLGVVFLATLLLYNLDGSIDVPKGARRRSRFYLHVGLSLGALGPLVVCLMNLPTRAAFLAAGGAVLCSLYALPLPLPGAARRLKELPYFKAPFIGISVATAVVWVPLLVQPGPIARSGAWTMHAVLALFCTLNAFLFDVPDRDEDRRNGTPTLAVRRGLAVVRLVCVCLSLLGIGGAFLGPTFPGARTGLVILGTILFGAALAVREDTRPSTIAWWIDGALLLPLLTL